MALRCQTDLIAVFFRRLNIEYDPFRMVVSGQPGRLTNNLFAISWLLLMQDRKRSGAKCVPLGNSASIFLFHL